MDLHVPLEANDIELSQEGADMRNSSRETCFCHLPISCMSLEDMESESWTEGRTFF
jgi:hypothetical protein